MNLFPHFMFRTRFCRLFLEQGKTILIQFLDICLNLIKFHFKKEYHFLKISFGGNLNKKYPLLKKFPFRLGPMSSTEYVLWRFALEEMKLLPNNTPLSEKSKQNVRFKEKISK